MKKVFKLFALVFALVSLVTLAACNNNSVTGTLEVTTTATKITATASFNKNSVLSESTTTVAVKLYNEDASKQLKTETVNLGSEKVQGSVTFDTLDTDTTYLVKLYVSYGGNQYLIDEVKTTTQSSGSSEEKPIEISSVSEFLAIEDDKDAYYKLTSDLDFTGQANVSLCSSSEPFKGVLDGNGYTIKNYTVAVGEYAGLFEYTQDATIKNVKLADMSIELTTSCKFVGALTGYSENTIIEDVTCDNFKVTTSSITTSTANIGGLVGVVTSEANSDYTNTSSEVTNSKVSNVILDLAQVRPSQNYLFYGGAFAGRISGATEVKNCKASGVIDIISKSSNGNVYVGGFAGAIESSKIVSNSYALVSISLVRSSNTIGKLAVGGFAGSNGTGQINLNSCYAFGDIEVLNDSARTSTTSYVAKEAYIGGIVGLLTSSTKGVKNCYYAKANFGIMAKQSETASSDYAGYVSTTIGFVSTLIKNKVSNVYSYDDCLNVTGMKTEGVDTISVVPANTDYEAVLGDDLKASFAEVLGLRDALALELAKFTYGSYTYTTTFTADSTIEISGVEILGTTTYVEYDGIALKVTPIASTKSDTSATTPIRVSVSGENTTLNALVHIYVGKAA